MRTCLALLATSVLITSLAAQEPVSKPPIEVRIIETLFSNKVISPAQREDLLRAADEMRREEAQVAALPSELAAAVAAVEERTLAASALLQHLPQKGFRFTSADEAFSLGIGGMLQLGYGWTNWQQNPWTNNEAEQSFGVERARIELAGHAFAKWARYRVLFDVAGDAPETPVSVFGVPVGNFEAESRFAELKEASLDLGLLDALHLKIGQFKVPYSRHFLTGSGNQLFVARAATDSIFRAGRQPGLMLHGAGMGEDDGLLEYALGIFNGEGENAANNDKGLLTAARIAINPLGALAYEDGDLTRTNTCLFAVGANAWRHRDDGYADDPARTALGLDFALRYAGWHLLAEWHRTALDTDAALAPSANGAFVQLGYTLIEDVLEAGLRSAEIRWRNNGDGDSGRREHLLVLGWHLKPRKWKLQADFGRIEDHQGDTKDNLDGWRLRLQMQLSF
jgi:hypothetical protein